MPDLTPCVPGGGGGGGDEALREREGDGWVVGGRDGDGKFVVRGIVMRTKCYAEGL